MWLSGLTQQAAVDASNRPTVDLVVSFCNEPESTVSWRPSAATLLRTRCEARTLIYCKCEWRSWCNRRLDNVGREGHTHLHHVAEHTVLADLTFLSTAASSTANRARACAASGSTRRTWCSAGSSRRSRVGAPAARARCRRRTATASRTATTTRARTWATAAAWNAGAGRRPRRSARPREAVRQSGSLAAYCSDGSRRCGLCTRMREVFGVHCDGADCACDDIGGRCFWKGKQAQSTEILTLSSPRSFLAWACHHWSITPEQLQRQQWQWTGTFAAGAQLVRMRPRLAYSDARDALAAGGRGGGVAGHFQERLWRAIFLSSLGGQRSRRRPTTIRGRPSSRGSSSRPPWTRATARPGSGRRSRSGRTLKPSGI